jgi:quercetin dioxygenase-like cupin family protein
VKHHKKTLEESGAGEITTGGKHFKIIRGDLFFRKPGIETQVIADCN